MFPVWFVFAKPLSTALQLFFTKLRPSPSRKLYEIRARGEPYNWRTLFKLAYEQTAANPAIA